jgi:hypothetical protein
MRKERVKKQTMQIRIQCRPGHCAMAALFAGCWLLVGSGRSDDTLPKGFDVARYQQLWERNPFTLVTPSVAQGPASPFSKLILVNWLHDKGKDIVFVQDTETNEVKKVTKEQDANPDQLRLIEVVPNKNPGLVFAKLTNGREEGTVKFRFDQPQNTQVANQNFGPRLLPGQSPGLPQSPGVPNNQFGNNAPGPGRRMPQIPGQAVNRQNGEGNNQAAPPNAQEIRRRRALPTPQQTQVPAPQNSNNAGADSSDDDE